MFRSRLRRRYVLLHMGQLLELAMVTRYTVLSWLAAAVASICIPIVIGTFVPDFQRPVSHGIAVLVGGLMLYPLARRTYRQRNTEDLPFWRFFPAPFSAAVVTMIVLGLVGG